MDFYPAYNQLMQEMRIGVIGTRGFPDVQGGIETHCQELYTRLAGMEGNVVFVYRRTPYLNDTGRNATFRNIRFIDLRIPKSKYFETFIHSLFATVHALFQHYDIVHFHNTGPGFFIPVLKLTKTKIVFTYHNVSYTQKKWNSFAKWFLSLSERVSMKNSDFVIFISEVIRSEMTRKYKIPRSMVLSNGVMIPEVTTETGYIESLGLSRKKYLVGVGRFMEEKGFDYLIRAFRMTGIDDFKLVLVGDNDYPTHYSASLKTQATENGVIMTGFIKGQKLNQVYSHAALFVMSSYTEGLPIALLEAMSYNIDVLVSNIPANQEIGLADEYYFRVGDVNHLRDKLIEKIAENKSHDYSEILNNKYNWDRITVETNLIYNNISN